MLEVEHRVGQNLEQLIASSLGASTGAGAGSAPNSARGKKRVKRIQKLITRPVEDSDLQSVHSASVGVGVGGDGLDVQIIHSPRSIDDNGSANTSAYASKAGSRGRSAYRSRSASKGTGDEG